MHALQVGVAIYSREGELLLVNDVDKEMLGDFDIENKNNQKGI